MDIESDNESLPDITDPRFMELLTKPSTNTSKSTQIPHRSLSKKNFKIAELQSKSTSIQSHSWNNEDKTRDLSDMYTQVNFTNI